MPAVHGRRQVDIPETVTDRFLPNHPTHLRNGFGRYGTDLNCGRHTSGIHAMRSTDRVPKVGTMSTSRTARSRAGWLADRPLALKLSAVVGLMALVAVVTAVLAVTGAHSLRDGEGRLYHNNVEPLVTLGALQRSFQGDRVRIIAYGTADAETRATLRADLEKRQGELQTLVAEYDGRQADDEAWAAMTSALTAYCSGTGQRLDAIDAGTAGPLGFTEEQPLSKAVMDKYALEADAQASAASEEAAAGESLAGRVTTQIVVSLLVGLVVA